MGLDKLNGMFFTESEDIAGLDGNMSDGISEFFTIELNRSGGDELLTKLTIRLFQMKTGLKCVDGQREHRSIRWDIGEGDIDGTRGGIAF